LLVRVYYLSLDGKHVITRGENIYERRNMAQQ